MLLPSPTSRIEFSLFHPDDAEDIYLLNHDPEVIRYTGDPPFESIVEAKDFMTAYQDTYTKYGYGRWTLRLRDSGAYIGWCGLKYNEDMAATDLGFRLLKKFWGQGLATEAANACIDHAFTTLGLERLVGRAVMENTASIQVLKKTGFVFIKKQDCHGMEAGYYLLEK